MGISVRVSVVVVRAVAVVVVSVVVGVVVSHRVEVVMVAAGAGGIAHAVAAYWYSY